MTTSTALSFIHRFAPGADLRARPVLLLHGTGGDENDLLGLGRTLAPGAALLSPRGKVLEHGMPRFFRRLAEGVFDQDDLLRQTNELADFVEAACKAYGRDPTQVTALGYSNGANIATSLLLRRPAALASAVLFRAMVPFVPKAHPDLTGKGVLIVNGRRDPIVPAAITEQLVSILEASGANVTLEWNDGGHALTQADVSEAQRWLAAKLREFRSTTK